MRRPFVQLRFFLRFQVLPSLGLRSLFLDTFFYPYNTVNNVGTPKLNSAPGKLCNSFGKPENCGPSFRSGAQSSRGYHFGPLFVTRDFFYGGTQLFEGSSFGFRFGVRFGTHFVTENSLKRRPKRKEKEQKAREAKMWFGYGRRYTGGT